MFEPITAESQPDRAVGIPGKDVLRHEDVDRSKASILSVAELSFVPPIAYMNEPTVPAVSSQRAVGIEGMVIQSDVATV